MKKNRVILIGLIVLIIFAVLYFCFRDYISLSYFQQKAHYFGTFVQSHYMASLCVYACLAVLTVTFSLPIVGPLTLLGGFLFGALPTLGVTCIAVPVGAAISFLSIRYFFSHLATDHFAEKRERFKAKMQKYGPSYLLTLNLVTVVPFGVICTLAALSGVSLWTLFWTSFVGSFPMLAVYSFAGRTFSEINSLGDLFSAPLILAFSLLALLSLIPMLLKRISSVDDV